MELLINSLNGNSNLEFTAPQIRLLVREIRTSTTLLDRAKAHLYVVEGITRNRLNPDLLLTVAVSEVNTPADLVIVAISLRHGANRNLYVQTPGVGPAHIIVYTVSVLRNAGATPNVVMLACLVLLIMGAQTVSPAFDQSGGRISEPLLATSPVSDTMFVDSIGKVLSNSVDRPLFRNQSRSRPNSKYEELSVQEWLRGIGLPPFDNVPELLDQLDPNVQTMLGTICDRPDLAISTFSGSSSRDQGIPEEVEYQVPNFEDLLVARSGKVIEALPITPKLRISEEDGGECVGIVLSIRALCYKAFVRLINCGLLPSYFTVTRLCIELRSAFRRGDTVATAQLQEMLQYAISKGTSLDIEQLAVISTTSDVIATAILNVYRKPKWRKVCSGVTTDQTRLPALEEGKSQEIPESLQQIAFNLNLDSKSDAESICTKLESYFVADSESLKKAAVVRQRARVGANVSTISDFVSGSAPNVGCQNRTVLQSDPFDYNDASMSFYRDGQGAVWCFVSNMYESLLENPVNPHTTLPLPSAFQAQLRSSVTILKRLGIPLSNPTSISSAIDDLSTDDEVTGKESEFIVETILQTSRVTGISPDQLRKLTPVQMNSILRTINMEQESLTLTTPDRQYAMTPAHQLITFCRAAYHMIKHQPDQARIFFDGIRMLL